MKVNHYLSIMAAVLLSALSIGFTACSQDEVYEPQQTKVDLLKAKAKEFAEKYGVEMSLNEDNIAQIAETLSVEQMEKDFQNFAELLQSTKPIWVTKKKSPTIKRLRIARSAIVVERDVEYKHEGETRGSVGIYVLELSYNWYYKQTGASGVVVKGSLLNDGIQIATANDHHHPNFVTSSGTIEFEVRGTLYFNVGSRYKLRVQYTADQKEIRIGGYD